MNFLISGAHISPIYLIGAGFVVGMLGGLFGAGAVPRLPSVVLGRRQIGS